jgi:hypothetical protein
MNSRAEGAAGGRDQAKPSPPQQDMEEKEN